MPTDTGVNMLSVDVECWHQIMHRNLTGQWSPPSGACLDMTRDMLAILRSLGVRATFFVLGQVAEAFPKLVREIDEDGHEVASHGFTHTPLSRLTPDQVADEVRRSVDILNNIVKKPILGFRAPEFSITNETLWALDILSEYHFAYDSSIFPFAGIRYGIAEFPKGIVRVSVGNRSILEVPPSTVNVLGVDLPAAGGRFYRVLPYPVVRRLVRRVNDDARSFLLYVHPYEITTQRLRVNGPTRSAAGSSIFRLEFQWNLFREKIRENLVRMVNEFRFAPIKEVLADAING